MSRGPGKIQRAVIAELVRRARWRIGADVDDLTAAIYKKKEGEASRAQLDTVYRAVKGLVEQKRIKQSSKISRHGNFVWVLAMPVQPNRKRGAPTPKPNLLPVP